MKPRVDWTTVLLCLVLATAACWPLAMMVSEGRDCFSFDVDLTSTAPGKTQIFFDVGRGLNESDSSVQPLGIHSHATTYRYLLPRGKIAGFRFDPTDHEGQLTISRARVVDFTGHVIHAFSPNDFRPSHQIETAAVEGSTLRLTTSPGATDPMLDVVLAAPLELKVTPALRFRAVMPIWIRLSCGLILICWVASLPIISDRLTAFKTTAIRPCVTLACSAAVAVVLQCYPVIFCGKSFVSPNNGSPFLYESFPTLPGSTDHEVEDTKGSDVAAMFHQSLYYPAIQNEALFRHHELPLWNRYFMCGLPLVGQGQSMFGSLLNFIPVIGNASATSWDIRYVVNRWWFGFGLGLAAWLLTRHLGSAVITSFAGTLVGFFGFRINHMAQFSVEAAPWVLVGWLLLREAISGSQVARALLVWALGNWELLNSGTVKEAYVLLAAMNVCGLGLLVVAPARPDRSLKLGYIAVSGVLFSMIAAPLLLCFARGLATSYTVSNQIAVYQMELRNLIGFFDDIFYSRLSDRDWRVLPSTNVVVLIGVGWALVRARATFRDRSFLICAASALCAGSFTFTVLPPGAIAEIPVLRNFGHLHNIFSCVLVVVVPLVAAFGFRELFAARETRRVWRDTAIVFGMIAAPAIWYFAKSSSVHASPFFIGYVGALVVGAVVAHAALALRQRIQRSSAIILAACFLLLTWRHAQYLKTPFDAYVFNPHDRVDFRTKSPAVEFVRGHVGSEPSRPTGFGMNILSGYSAMLDWESAYGVDAVRNQNYDTLMAAGNVAKFFWPIPETMKQLGGDASNWHEDRLDLLVPIHDMLNVRFYLATPGFDTSKTRLERLFSADLDVYQSPSTWPRAFVTDQLFEYREVHELTQKLRTSTDRRPFAGVQSESADTLRHRLPHGASSARVVTPARAYQLTANTTSFSIDAPGPGVAVLTENYYPEDFRATIDGKSVPYFRVNHSFKGVLIPSAGTHQVTFEYWPKHLTAALWVFVAGLVLACTGTVWLWRRPVPV